MLMDEEKIKSQAKAIMDEFIRALELAGLSTGEGGLEREEMTREAKKTEPESEFRKRMLKNAPKKDNSHIIAERKSW